MQCHAGQVLSWAGKARPGQRRKKRMGKDESPEMGPCFAGHKLIALQIASILKMFANSKVGALGGGCGLL